MCDPVSIASVALSIAGTYAQYETANNAADAQDAQNQLTRNILVQNESLEQMDIARQRQQEYEAASAEANAYSAQARKELGTLDTLLGEGFAGNTGNRQLTTVGIKHGEGFATLASNSNKVQQELGFASSAASNSRNQRMASLKDADRPSAAGAMLTIAGQGLNSYKDYKASTTKTSTK
jgi:Rps23 Pro-64 3,4-dihydroxylase Tpa1-like proline 4-hydroxylase